MSFGGIEHAVPHKLRKCGFIGMLQLAPTACAKVRAGWKNVMRAVFNNGTVSDTITWKRSGDVHAGFGHAVATRGNADNGLAHKQAATAC